MVGQHNQGICESSELYIEILKAADSGDGERFQKVEKVNERTARFEELFLDYSKGERRAVHLLHHAIFLFELDTEEKGNNGAVACQTRSTLYSKFEECLISVKSIVKIL